MIWYIKRIGLKIMQSRKLIKGYKNEVSVGSGNFAVIGLLPFGGMQNIQTAKGAKNRSMHAKYKIDRRNNIYSQQPWK